MGIYIILIELLIYDIYIIIIDDGVLLDKIVEGGFYGKEK